MFQQLNPSIPMHTPKGDGYAIGVIDYSQEHNLSWVVAMNATGEIWVVPNSQVKLQWNYSLGRGNIKPVDCKLPDGVEVNMTRS